MTDHNVILLQDFVKRYKVGTPLKPNFLLDIGANGKFGFNQDHASACLIVIHDPRLAARCDRAIALVDGQVVTS